MKDVRHNFQRRHKNGIFRNIVFTEKWKGLQQEVIPQAQKTLSWPYRKRKLIDYSTPQSTHIHTSVAVTFSASQSTLGRIFLKNEGLYSISDCSSSASRKCSGKDNEELLHAFTAQVKKLTVSIFIFLIYIEWQQKERQTPSL